MEDVDTVFAMPDRTPFKMTEVAQRMFDGTARCGAPCAGAACARPRSRTSSPTSSAACRARPWRPAPSTTRSRRPGRVCRGCGLRAGRAGVGGTGGCGGRRRGGLRLDTGEAVQGLSTQPLPGGVYHQVSLEQKQHPLTMPIRFVEGGQAGFEADAKFVHEAMRYCVEPPVTRTLEIEGEKMLEIEVVVHVLCREAHACQCARRRRRSWPSRAAIRLWGATLGLDDGRWFREDALKERVTMQCCTCWACLTDRAWPGQWPT